jgi:hypothetical protein
VVVVVLPSLGGGGVWIVPLGSNGNNGKYLRIMVVDDVFTHRKLLIRLPQIRRHYCDEAEGGQEAVDKVVEALKGKGRQPMIARIVETAIHGLIDHPWVPSRSLK